MDKAKYGGLKGHKAVAGHVPNASKGLKTIGGSDAKGMASAVKAAKSAGIKVAMGKAPKAIGKGC